ncbi:10207_t:CDS:2 [Acaulospora colombiana]|uniref:10207_t:CDS:1 n=1 Tax=Acaulospora colombiana TaxID=27376 RepID=A0ACA9K0Y5_9GLOM|nr:10207_t:CDS:2 [Acaulospora colombiana]
MYTATSWHLLTECVILVESSANDEYGIISSYLHEKPEAKLRENGIKNQEVAKTKKKRNPNAWNLFVNEICNSMHTSVDLKINRNKVLPFASFLWDKMPDEYKNFYKTLAHDASKHEFPTSVFSLENRDSDHTNYHEASSGTSQSDLSSTTFLGSEMSDDYEIFYEVPAHDALEYEFPTSAFSLDNCVSYSNPTNYDDTFLNTSLEDLSFATFLRSEISDEYKNFYEVPAYDAPEHDFMTSTFSIENYASDYNPTNYDETFLNTSLDEFRPFEFAQSGLLDSSEFVQSVPVEHSLFQQLEFAEPTSSINTDCSSPSPFENDGLPFTLTFDSLGFQ